MTVLYKTALPCFGMRIIIDFPPSAWCLYLFIPLNRVYLQPGHEIKRHWFPVRRLLFIFLGSPPPAIGPSSWSQAMPQSPWCWDTHVGSGKKKTTLESFTVTFCVCGRKHHPHASHGNGICLFQKNLVSSSRVSHFSFPSFLYINFNSWPSHFISVMTVDCSDCEP